MAPNDHSDLPIFRREIKIYGRLRFDSMAELLALIAYPNAQEKRELFAKAIRADAVATTLGGDPDWDPGISAVSYTQLPGEDLGRALSVGLRTIDDRLVAAKQVMPWAKKSLANLTGKDPPLSGGQRLSKDAVFAIISEEQGEKGERTQRKIWAASLPVIHLSAALRATCEQRLSEQPGASGYTLGMFIDASPVEFVRHAAEIRSLLLNLKPSENSRGPNSVPNFCAAGLINVIAV